MKTTVEKILRAERDARLAVDEANRRAQRILEESRTQDFERRKAAVSQARAEKEAALERAKAQAEEERGRILEAARTRAQRITARAKTLDHSFLGKAIREIAGLE